MIPMSFRNNGPENNYSTDDINDQSVDQNLDQREFNSTEQTELFSTLENSLSRLKSIISELQHENAILKQDNENNTRLLSELNESNAHLRKTVEERCMVKTDKSFSIAINCISDLYNEILDNTGLGDILRDNTEIIVEDFKHDLEKTGIILDYHKRGELPDGRSAQISIKTTGNKEEDRRIASSRIGFHSDPYLEGFSKQEELLIYSYDKSQDSSIRLITIFIHESDPPIRNQSYSGEMFNLPNPSSYPPGKDFKGWSFSENGTTIDSDCILLNQDTHLYPIYESKKYELHIHFKSPLPISVPGDIIDYFEEGEYFSYDFEPYNGLIPDQKHIEGKIGPKPLKWIITYVPGQSQLSFDEHFKVKSGNSEIASGEFFDDNSVEVLVKTKNMTDDILLFKLRNLRSARHDISLREIDGQEGTDSFIIDISFEGNVDKSTGTQMLSYKLGTTMLDSEKVISTDSSEIRLIDSGDSNGVFHLNYNIEDRVFKIIWTAAHKSIHDKIDLVKYGKMPEPHSFPPIIEPNKDEITFFEGWDKEIVAAKSDRTYTATHGNPTSLSGFIKNLCKKKGPLSAKQIAQELKCTPNKLKKTLDNMKSNDTLLYKEGCYSLIINDDQL